MSSNRLILVVNGQSYSQPFKGLAERKDLRFAFNNRVLFDDPSKVALVVFTGGEDVSPELYGMKAHRSTGNNPHRDREEAGIFDKAYKHNIPMAGICRGSQFLCVMAGGKLVQDITGHAGREHDLVVEFGGKKKKVMVNSSHHQMQLPFYTLKDGEDYQLVGYMESPLSRHYALDDKVVIPAGKADDKITLEPDIVYYPKIKALAAQYHPEWLPEDHSGAILYQELIKEYIEPMLDDETRTVST